MGVPAAIIVGSLITGGGAIASGIIGSGAASDAAEAQAAAAESATDVQERMSDKAIAAQKEAQDKAIATQLEMFYQSREDIAPWREMGGDALASLRSIFIDGGGVAGLKDSGSFAPTTVPDFAGPAIPKEFQTAEYQESPYYNFLQDEGMQALARQQSATGRTASGAALKEAQRFGQGLASTDYNNWLTNYINTQTFKQSQQSNALTDWLRKQQFTQGERSNYINEWLATKVNPLMSLSGAGQVSAGQSANLGAQTGQGIASNYLNTGQGIASNYLTTGQNIGQNYLTAGQAQAGGYINQANAATGAITGIGNLASQGVNQYLFYDWLKNQPSSYGSGASSYSGPYPSSYGP